MLFYPDLTKDVEYVKQVADKYGHDARKLAEKIREIGAQKALF